MSRLALRSHLQLTLTAPLQFQAEREGPSSTELFLESVRRGVAFVPGPFFFSAGQAGPASPAAIRGLRLSYSAVSPADIERGVGLLEDALASLNGVTRPAEPVVYGIDGPH